MYEFVVRRFLACVSKDAQGHETIVHIDINGEKVFKLFILCKQNYYNVMMKNCRVKSNNVSKFVLAKD